MTAVVVPCPGITFCLGSLDKELVSMGLASLPACSSIMVKKREHLLQVSRSPLMVLKVHFISSEEQRALRSVLACVLRTQRRESFLGSALKLKYKHNRANDRVLTVTRQLGLQW